MHTHTYILFSSPCIIVKIFIHIIYRNNFAIYPVNSFTLCAIVGGLNSRGLMVRFSTRAGNFYLFRNFDKEWDPCSLLFNDY